MGQTVNLLAYAFGGSNPSLPTHFLRDCAARMNDTVSFFFASARKSIPRWHHPMLLGNIHP